MTILSRVGVVLVLLALPLALAVGSQALAERPGSPPLPDQPVELVEQPSTPPATTSDDPPSGEPSDRNSEESSPRVVTPSPQVSVGSAGSDDDDDDGEGGEGDD